jgi:aspartyl protease family protein
MERLLASILVLLAPAAAAQTVTLNGQLGNQQAVLVIDGDPVAVSVGQSQRGVRLLSLGPGRAEVEIAGVRKSLTLGAGPVRVRDGEPSSGYGSSIVLTANEAGHFIAQGQINGAAVTFMVDTGATVVAIGQADADRMGLNYKNAPSGFANTANGRIPVRAIMLSSVRIGDVVIPNVQAAVLPSQMAHVLLGNSFLTRFQMKRDNDTLLLEKRPN